ncbi:MAG: hypothetical protein QM536_02400 [Chitinophagaceae bacterium]|nr:hypothetical protein [Chitinophagaceae bacterium]
MRIVKQITHPACNITLFSWNQKYIVKFEYGMMEQVYKISELEMTEAEVLEYIDDDFIRKVMDIFSVMEGI